MIHGLLGFRGSKNAIINCGGMYNGGKAW